MQSSVCACRGCHGHGSMGMGPRTSLQWQGCKTRSAFLTSSAYTSPGDLAPTPPLKSLCSLAGAGIVLLNNGRATRKHGIRPASGTHIVPTLVCKRPAPGKPRDSAWGVLKPFYNFFLFFKSRESCFGNGFSWCHFAAVHLQGMGILPHVQECTT